MIPNNRLALIKCFHCNELFKANDQVCTISERVWDSFSMDFKELTIRTTESEIAVPMEVNFHKECFVEIAGSQYTPG